MTRKQAEKEYKAALAAWNKAQDVSEAAFAAANARLTIARKNLVAAEIATPTRKEIKRHCELLRLGNRGLDA